MSVLFSDGFESGDFSAWTSASASGGVGLGVTAGAALHGNTGCRVSVSGSGAAHANAHCRKDFGLVTRELWGRLYLRLVDADSWVITFLDVAVFGDYWSNQHVCVYKSGGEFRIRTTTYVDTPSPAWASSPSLMITPEVPHCVEVYQKMSDDPENENGIIRLWLDDEGFVERTGIKNSNKLGAARIHVPFVYNLQSPAELTLDFDDVAASMERVYPVVGRRRSVGSRRVWN